MTAANRRQARVPRANVIPFFLDKSKFLFRLPRAELINISWNLKNSVMLSLALSLLSKKLTRVDCDV